MEPLTNWKSLRRQLVRFARNTGVSQADAEDIAQHLLERMLARGDRDAPASSHQYNWRMCANEARSEHRRRSRRTRREIACVFMEQTSESPESEFLEQECVSLCSKAFSRALAEFPYPVVQAFLLCDVHDMAASKAATLLGCPEGTVRTRIRRVRAFLRPALERALQLHGPEALRRALDRTAFEGLLATVA